MCVLGMVIACIYILFMSLITHTLSEDTADDIGTSCGHFFFLCGLFCINFVVLLYDMRIKKSIIGKCQFAGVYLIYIKLSNFHKLNQHIFIYSRYLLGGDVM